MTEAQVRREIADMVGRQQVPASAVARQLGVSPSYLSDVLSGRRAPGPKILETLGLEKITKHEYMRKKS